MKNGNLYSWANIPISVEGSPPAAEFMKKVYEVAANACGVKTYQVRIKGVFKL